MELFKAETIRIERPQLELVYHPNFLAQQNELMQEIKAKATWHRDRYKLFGREVDAPRLSCFYAEKGVNYNYSGMLVEGKGIPKYLENILNLVNTTCAHSFNSILINYYKNGADYMGWHADNEPELGENPKIASLNIGTSRRFQFKHRKLKNEKLEVLLNPSDLLVMQGETQHFWLHQLPKSLKVKTERINLTFRQILPSA